MYPYPSASYMHMGHVRNYTIGDVYARYKANRAVAIMDRNEQQIEDEQIFINAANDFMNFIKNNSDAAI